MKTYLTTFKTQADIRINELIKETLEDGTINMYFTSQDSRTKTSFQNAADYMNSLLGDGYILINIWKDTSGDYGTYTDDHKYVVFKDGRFIVSTAPMGDFPHYDNEWIKYTLAKQNPNIKKELNIGDKVQLILWNRDDKYSLTIEEKIVAENLGGYITFQDEPEYDYSLEDIHCTLDLVISLYSGGYGMRSTFLSPNKEFTKLYIKTFEEQKEIKLKKNIENTKKQLKELELELKQDIEVTIVNN